MFCDTEESLCKWVIFGKIADWLSSSAPEILCSELRGLFFRKKIEVGEEELEGKKVFLRKSVPVGYIDEAVPLVDGFPPIPNLTPSFPVIP